MDTLQPLGILVYEGHRREVAASNHRTDIAKYEYFLRFMGAFSPLLLPLREES